jgi:hypothetical protein
MAVTPRPIKCGADLPDGTKCKEFATVMNTQYVYDRQPVAGDHPDYKLKEIHYRAVCPKCGERKVVKS